MNGNLKDFSTEQRASRRNLVYSLVDYIGLQEMMTGVNDELANKASEIYDKYEEKASENLHWDINTDPQYCTESEILDYLKNHITLPKSWQEIEEQEEEAKILQEYNDKVYDYMNEQLA